MIAFVIDYHRSCKILAAIKAAGPKKSGGYLGMKEYVKLFITVFLLVLVTGGIFLYALKQHPDAIKNAMDMPADPEIPEDEENLPPSDMPEETPDEESGDTQVPENTGTEAEVIDLQGVVSTDAVSEDGAESKYNKEDFVGNAAESMDMFVEPASEDGSIKIGFAGDVLLDPGYAIYSSYRQRGGVLSNCISNDLIERMRSEDVMIVNNEFPYSDRGTPAEGKQYTFRAAPSSVSILSDMGVDAVSVANNHAFDYGEEAFMDTLTTLEGAGIPHIGGGRDIAEASRPLYIYTDNMKVAVIASSQIERNGSPHSRAAGENRPGMLRSFSDIEPTLAAIRKAKEEADYVILYIHWGTENQVDADWAQNEQLPKFIDAGADCIIGGHPHILQPLSWEGNVPVVYSLGNFWFNSKALDTGMVELNISPDGLKNIRFVPCRQQGCGVSLLHDSEYNRLLDYMRSISPKVTIDDEGYFTPAG